MRAIAAIGRRLDLDYAGVDFTLLPDGRVLVFEANATMLVHRERIDGMAAHKNPYVERIVCAFEQLQLRLAACAPLLAPKDDSSHS
jgi:glutathione synthase/RimK-type ligase-like ATP-grasp enzyme